MSKIMNQLRIFFVLIIENDLTKQEGIVRAYADQTSFYCQAVNSIQIAIQVMKQQAFDVIIYNNGMKNEINTLSVFLHTPIIIMYKNNYEQYTKKGEFIDNYHFIKKDNEELYLSTLPKITKEVILSHETEEQQIFDNIITQNSSEAIALVEILNNNLIIKAVNPTFLTWTGYQKNILLHQDLNFIRGENPDEAVSNEIQKAIFDKKNITVESALFKKDQALFWGKLQFKYLKKPIGKARYLVSIQDISKQKDLEAALIAAKTQAERSHLVEQKFLASMSHEIRTPLNAIMGMTHLLKDAILSEEHQEYLKAIRISSENLLNTISDILDISKIQANKIEFSEKQFNLFELLLELQQAFQYQLKDKNLQIVIDLDLKLSNDVIGDGDRIKQVLHNLLSNAIKFTEEGEVGVKVVLKSEKEGIYELEFSVFDTGIGMTSTELDVIFENFRQANEEIQNRYGGSGLGLSIAKQLVDHLGGKISAKSEINKGSVFKFILPLKDSGILSSISPIKSIISKNDAEILKGLKVLVAEDNTMNQKLIEGMLSKWKCEFNIVDNGKSAVDLFNQKEYDIVFMDINMPVMNGYDAAKGIRNSTKKNSQIPIIALTAAVLSTEKERVFASGMNEYLTKPFHPKRLKAMVLKLVRAPYQIEKERFLKTENNNENKNLLKTMVNINFNYLKEFSGGDVSFMEEMVSMFLAQIPQETSELKQLLDEKSWYKLGKLAHKMKPNYLMMGMEGQKGMAKEIEHLCLSETVDTSHVQMLTEQLIRDTNVAIPMIEQKMASL